jgi:hypothetical protein
MRKLCRWLTKICLILVDIKPKYGHFRWQKVNKSLGLSITTFILIVGDHKLFFATSMGIITMFVFYQQPWGNWQKFWLKWQNFLHSSNGKLAIAITSGGIVTVITYVIAAIWENSDNNWLALEVMVLELITTATLGLLGWYIFTQKTQQNQDKLAKLCADLSNPSPLRRLIAVNSLAELVKNNQLDANQQSEIQDYFQLMLSIEPDLKIRHSLQKNLNLNKSIVSPHHNQPLPPLQNPLKKSKVPELTVNN